MVATSLSTNCAFELISTHSIYFGRSSASPTWRPAPTGSRARRDSWISSSPVRGQSNRAEGFDSRIVGHTEVIQNTSYCVTYADINKTSHTNPRKPRLDRVGY